MAAEVSAKGATMEIGEVRPLGTLARKAAEAGCDVVIVSSDKNYRVFRQLARIPLFALTHPVWDAAQR